LALERPQIKIIGSSKTGHSSGKQDTPSVAHVCFVAQPFKAAQVHKSRESTSLEI